MEQYQQAIGAVFSAVCSSEAGLSREEAARRLALQGKNELRAGRRKSKLALFFAQFKDLMSLILISAAVLSCVLAFATGDRSELADTAILLAIILLNAVVGFLQQYRADAALEKLKTLSVCRAKAVRGGKIVLVNAEELVVGDVIELEEGDRVPADCRVIRGENFRCDESALTGESKPVKKYDCVVRRTALAERANTAHLASFCVRGRARCLVVATGMQTEMGRIAGMLGEEKPAPTPLERAIAKLGKIITGTVLTVAAVLFLGGLLAGRVGLLQNVMSAVAVAVAAIPEGMGAVVTIIMAMGVQRMARSRAVVRRLSAVETLGGCTCICSDKTGTLTKNRMTVEEIATMFPVTARERYTGTAGQRRLVLCMRACHSVKGSAGGYVGDPTEIALVEYADRCGTGAAGREIGGIPFSSERRMMSVAVRTEEGERLFVKGGTDAVLRRCRYLRTEQGKVLLGTREREAIVRAAEECASRAMRVLAFAEGAWDGSPREEGLTFLGIAAMSDPPKEGVREAVAACLRAGIRTVMITGDSADTALAIAKRLGIASRREEVMTGEELDGLDEASFARRARRIRVYARVSPKHKSEIVRALKAAGEVVAMTGDGINDAPSIRAADIGVAMGSGTDVTKDAADMVLADDDFTTMVHAVEEGRNVFYNVKKTISFFLATNLAEVLAVLAATLFFRQCGFLTSTQLLWINLITDSLPVLALGVERGEGAMERPPVSEKSMFSRRALVRVAVFGAVQAAIVVGLFAFGVRFWGEDAARTAAFLSMSLLELFYAFPVKGEGETPSLRRLGSNRTLLWTVVLGVAVNVLLVAIPPLSSAFGVVPLTGGQWAAVFALSLAIVPLGLMYEAAQRAFGRLRRRKRRIPLRGSAR